MQLASSNLHATFALVIMPSGNILLRTAFACAAAFLAFRYYVSFRSAQNALPFKVVNLPNRGKGLVATRDIIVSILIKFQHTRMSEKKSTAGGNDIERDAALCR